MMLSTSTGLITPDCLKCRLLKKHYVKTGYLFLSCNNNLTIVAKANVDVLFACGGSWSIAMMLSTSTGLITPDCLKCRLLKKHYVKTGYLSCNNNLTIVAKANVEVCNVHVRSWWLLVDCDDDVNVHRLLWSHLIVWSIDYWENIT